MEYLFTRSGPTTYRTWGTTLTTYPTVVATVTATSKSTTSNPILALHQEDPTFPHSSSSPSLWPYFFLAVLAAASAYAALSLIKGAPQGCVITITGSTVQVSNCPLEKIPAVVESFRWSSHGDCNHLPHRPSSGFGYQQLKQH